MSDDKAARQEQFAGLIERYHMLVRKLCWRYSNGDPVRCAELVQDCYIALWRRLPDLRPDAGERQRRSWVAWRCRSALQHSLGRRRHRWHPLDTVADNYADDTGEQRDKVEELAVGLTDREQRYLSLLLDGYTHKEIAALMDRELDTIDKMRLRIMEKMRQNANTQHHERRHPGTDA